MPIDINAGPLKPKLGEVECLYVVRIYSADRTHYLREYFGRS